MEKPVLMHWQNLCLSRNLPDCIVTHKWTFLSYDLWSALIFRITSSSSAMKFVYLQRTNLLIYFTTNFHQESFYKKAPAVIHTTGNQSCLRL